MLKIRRPLGRLIFNMGIAIPGKTVFLIETAPWYQSTQCIIGMEFVDSLRYNKCTSGKVYKSYDIKARTAFDIGQPCNRTGFVILYSTSMTIWHNEAGTKCPPSCIHHLQIMGCLSWVSWKIKNQMLLQDQIAMIIFMIQNLCYLPQFGGRWGSDWGWCWRRHGNDYSRCSCWWRPLYGICCLPTWESRCPVIQETMENGKNTHQY